MPDIADNLTSPPDALGEAALEQPSAATPVRTMWCKGCAQLLPIENFGVRKNTHTQLNGKLRSHAVRRSLCKPCSHKKRVAKAAKQKENVDSAILSRYIKRGGKKIEAIHIAELGALLTVSLNGAEKACDRWAATVEFLELNDPKAAAKCFADYFSVIKHATVLRPTSVDTTNLSDEDLDREARALAHEIMTEGQAGEN